MHGGGRRSGRAGAWAVIGIIAAALAGAAPPAQAGCLIPGINVVCTSEPAPPPAPDPGGREEPDQAITPSGKPFGFNLGYKPVGDTTPEPSLAAMEATGARVLRYVVAWRGFEGSTASRVVTDEMRQPPERLDPESGLRSLDERYADLVARGITPLIVLGYVPPWASLQHQCLQPLYALLNPGRCPRGWQDGQLFPAPEFYAQWREFVAWAVRRWPHAVFEGPNEPDIGHPRPATSPTPAAAAGIQCELYRAAKSVDSRPVLSMAVTEPGYVRDYLPSARGCYDVYSFHPYPGGTEFGAGSSFAQLFATLRETRAAAGDTTPIWITETGFAFVPRGDAVGDAYWESVYSDATRRLYNRLITMDDVGAVLLHTLRDRAIWQHSDRDGAEYHFGLFYEDWSPKPRACHFVAMAGDAWPGC